MNSVVNSFILVFKKPIVFGKRTMGREDFVAEYLYFSKEKVKKSTGK
ncbi:hypothetical protein Fluta_3255 [Fluviicola taffensis DSM 16823]|uniref:Uncharacterized protein n=1 Tax=Fluviicola taffensis (strain DSM 16823 / NCIMB 13979 / RW262) TaxID=755732 RepID=F2IA51_FLUTR|nr:hypothetical protein Fluta_3255 [Fluviicola taffensis DSM 16823]